MIASVPLNPGKVQSGSWNLLAYDSSDADWLDYDSDVTEDLNGDTVAYGTYGSFGVWSDDDADGYSGWWWSHDQEFTYEGVTYDHDGIVVLDADDNGIYDSSIDFVVAYGYGDSSGGDSGTWDRTNPYSGTYSGGSLGEFVITVALDYEGTNSSDYVVGSTVADNLKGDGGNDKLYGFKGNDKIYGESGKDKLYGQTGKDRLYGGSSADKLYGGSGKDYLKGGSGKDKLYGGSSADRLYGNSGKDYLKGGSGKDKLYGGSSKDKLYGGSSADKLYGGSGNDYLKGNSGNDTLVGGKGTDTIYGGSGKDIFKLTKGSGYDKIRDFKKGQDRIYVKGMKNIRIKDAGKHSKIFNGSDLLAVIYNEDNIYKSGKSYLK